MEKIILVNTVEISSQLSSSEINEYGQVVKIAITDGQQVLSCQVVLAKDKTTAITTNHLQNTIEALERLLTQQETVKLPICERSLCKVAQTFVRSL